jgi:hypothetical protein
LKESDGVAVSLMQLVNQLWLRSRAKKDVTALRIVGRHVECSANLSIHAVTRRAGINKFIQLVRLIETRKEPGQRVSILKDISVEQDQDV